MVDSPADTATSVTNHEAEKREIIPAASIVICTYNRPELLEAAVLSCIRNASRKSLRFEIVIADNSITGHAGPLVKRLNDSIIPVRQVISSPPNIAIARNAGLHAARAPLIAFIDDDTEPQPGWLDALVEILTQTGADAAVGPIHPKFPSGAPDWDETGRRFQRTLSYPSGKQIAIAGPDRPRDFAIGTNGSIWRAATCFTDQEPFNESFGAAGGEDFDLFLRIEGRGLRIIWCAEAGVVETIPTSRTSFQNQLMRIFSSTQGYAAAHVNNSPMIITHLSIVLRGFAQAVIYAPLCASFGILALFGSGMARRLFNHCIFKMTGGLGKMLWWRRLKYYHLEVPGTLQ